MGFGSYETAWAWLHKLRRAMVRPDRDRLCGVVEVDETFVGGVTRRHRRRRHRQGAGADRGRRPWDRNRLGRVRFAVADRARQPQTSSSSPARTVEPGSTIRTDGARMLRRLADRGYHPRIRRRLRLSPTSPTELPGVHSRRVAAQALDRRHPAPPGVRQHLPYYLDEYAFRFNRRNSKARGMLFYRLLQQAVATDPHPLHDSSTNPDPTPTALKQRCRTYVRLGRRRNRSTAKTDPGP